MMRAASDWRKPLAGEAVLFARRAGKEAGETTDMGACLRRSFD